jgi:putative exosortase-associated protein (TIGR04073 family)
MSRRLTKLVVICLVSIVLEGVSGAAGYRNIETASPQDIVEGMATKGVRGAANIVTGWVEIPKQIYITGKETGWLRGSIIGPLKGVGMTVVRTVSGAGEPRFVWMKESSVKDSPF